MNYQPNTPPAHEQPYIDRELCERWATPGNGEALGLVIDAAQTAAHSLPYIARTGLEMALAALLSMEAPSAETVLAFALGVIEEADLTPFTR